MSKAKTAAAIPQRYQRGRGWIECQPHQAQAWAAMLGARLIGRYGNKALALDAIASSILRKQGPRRRYQLGGVLEKRRPDIGRVATSLTRAQYNALKGEQA